MSQSTDRSQDPFARNLVRELIARHPIDAARALAGAPREELAELVFTQAPASAAELLRRLNPDDAAEVHLMLCWNRPKLEA